MIRCVCSNTMVSLVCLFVIRDYRKELSIQDKSSQGPNYKNETSRVDWGTSGNAASHMLLCLTISPK